jgi:hypothetical protein
MKYTYDCHDRVAYNLCNKEAYGEVCYRSFKPVVISSLSQTNDNQIMYLWKWWGYGLDDRGSAAGGC